MEDLLLVLVSDLAVISNNVEAAASDIHKIATESMLMIQTMIYEFILSVEG